MHKYTVAWEVIFFIKEHECDVEIKSVTRKITYYFPGMHFKGVCRKIC